MSDHLEPGAFAVGNDEQYRPVQAVGDQRVRVGGPAWLTCHASRPLDGPGRGDGPLVVVVHGALRDSDRYLAHARHAARLAATRSSSPRSSWRTGTPGRRPASLTARCTGMSRAGKAATPRCDPRR